MGSRELKTQSWINKAWKQITKLIKLCKAISFFCASRNNRQPKGVFNATLVSVLEVLHRATIYSFFGSLLIYEQTIIKTLFAARFLHVSARRHFTSHTREHVRVIC